MNVPPISLNLQSPGGVPINVVTPPPQFNAAGDQKQLREAARDFVAILYTHMFQTMREAGQSDEEGGLFNSFESNMFMGFFDQEVGLHFANQGGGTLVDALFRQINKAGQSGQAEAQPGQGAAAGLPAQVPPPGAAMQTAAVAPPPVPPAPPLPIPGTVKPQVPGGLAPVVTPPPLPLEMPGTSDHHR